MISKLKNHQLVLAFMNLAHYNATIKNNKLKLALVGITTLIALVLVGYAVQIVTPHSAPFVLAVAPPSPTPGPQVSPIPFPSPVPTPSPITIVASPIAVPPISSSSPIASPLSTPNQIPSVSPLPTPPSTISPQSTSIPNNTWTSLGSVGGVTVFRYCDGHVSVYLALGAGLLVISTQANGCP